MARIPSDLDLPNLHTANSEAWGFEGGWQRREDAINSLEHASYCSYCGSVDPLSFIELCKPGSPATRFEVADWKYGWPHKVYVDVASPDPSRLTYLGGRYEASVGEYAKGGSRYTPPEPDMVAMADLTEAQLEILKRDGAWREGEDSMENPDPLRYFRFGTRDIVYQKFYAEHLLDLGAEKLAAVADTIERRTGVAYLIEDGKLKYRGIPRGRF
jgi:hypothetical protein